MRCTGLVFLLVCGVVSRIHGLVYETADAIVVEVDELSQPSAVSGSRQSRQSSQFPFFNFPSQSAFVGGNLNAAFQQMQQLQQAVQSTGVQQSTSAIACWSKSGVQGKCVSFRQCYPYFKVPALGNLESWVLGVQGTCNYAESDGRQRYGVCCQAGSATVTKPQNTENNQLTNNFNYQQPSQFPFQGGFPFTNFQQQQFGAPQTQQFPPAGYFPGLIPALLPFPGMYPGGYPSQPSWPGVQQPQFPQFPQFPQYPQFPQAPQVPQPPQITGQQEIPSTTTSTTTVTTTQPTVQQTTPTTTTTTPPAVDSTTTTSTTTTTTTTTTPSAPSGADTGINGANCGMTGNVDRIVGGVEAKPGEFPWIAALLNGGRQFCGGSLIDSIHILTAAHCVAHMSSWDVARLEVRLNEFNIRMNQGNEITRRVRRVTRHKGFDSKTLYNDIAILTLDSPVDSPVVRPVCLPTGSQSYAGQEAIVAGWGSLREGGSQPDTLQKVDVTIKTNADCKSNYGSDAPGGIIDSFLCAAKTNKDSCSGDSGGPLHISPNGLGSNGPYIEVGIVSWGIGCGQSPYPGVYTRVTSFLNWIQTNLN